MLDASTFRNSQPRAVDIYSGCGGLSLGLELGGFAVAYAVDWDGSACATHSKNFRDAVVERRDVREVSGNNISRAAGGPIALVAGGASAACARRTIHETFPEFVRLVSELKPAMFLMENVPGIAHRHNFALLRTIYGAFERLGYRCAGDVLLAADYGVPQLRYRFFLVGTLTDIDLTFPAPTHAPRPTQNLLVQPQVTVWDAIGDLPSIESRQADEPIAYASAPQTSYQRAMREGAGDVVTNHVCSAPDDINLRRAKFEGARLRRDMPAFTITASFGAFTHPLDNRALSMREGARLQSFPDRFTFSGPRNSQYKQIGNAVPPMLGAAMARHLRELLAGGTPSGIRPRVTSTLLNDPRGGDALPVLTPRFKELFGQATRWPKARASG